MNMARRRGKKRGSRSRSIPLFALLPLAPGIPPLIEESGLANKVKVFTYQVTGYHAGEKKLDMAIVGRQLGLAVAGVIGHKIANKTVNKYIPKWLMVKL
jgi:hypothetical protein